MFNKVDVSGDSVVQMYDSSGGERIMDGPFILGMLKNDSRESGDPDQFVRHLSGFRENIVHISAKVKAELQLF